jgi:lysine 2,3-aminomutase
MRVTDEFLEMVRKYHPVYINLHFNHPKEITQEVAEACARMANAGIPLANQTVLLRGINDCPHVMKELCQKLLRIRVRPYYIYQCDLAMGIGHFRTNVSKGIQIIEALRGHTSGMAVPVFVVDAPGGGGKIPVMPNYVLSQSSDTWILRNYEGMITPYRVPHSFESVCGHDPACAQEQYQSKKGPAHMYENPNLFLEPKEELLK